MVGKDTEDLLRFLANNLPMHIIIENEVRLMPFGQMTFNVMLKDGVANIDTLNIVKNRRRRYGVDSNATIVVS